MGITNGNYRQYKLDNGLVVALQNLPSKTFFSKLIVNYGSSHEKEDEKGLAHFLEHCLATGGNKKYPLHVTDGIRGGFGHFNAFTNSNRTWFEASSLSEDIPIWIDYISHQLFNPRFDEERFNGEKERVLREISDSKSSLNYEQTERLRELLYKGHPKAISPLGNEEIVRTTSVDGLKKFYSRGYYPNNMDLIIAGGLPENIECLIGDYFNSFEQGENTRKDFPVLAPLDKKTIIHVPAPGRVNKNNHEDSSANVYLYFSGPAENHPDYPAASILMSILGHGTNSALYQNLGLKKGLAYSTSVRISGTDNAGHIEAYAKVPATRIDEAVDAIFEETEKVKKEKINEKQIEQIKKAAEFELAGASESNKGQVGLIENKLINNETLEQILCDYKAVTSEKILEVANKYFSDKETGNYVLFIRDPLKI